MKWAWRVGQIAGIDVYIHGTFLLLLGWVAVTYHLPRRSLDDALAGLVFILAVFGIVVLHELGHALTARRFGIHTRDITLLPIGGVARLERMPDDPRQEVLVALAGPAVNVALAALLFFFLGIEASLTSGAIELSAGNFLKNLLWVNVSLAAFNLLPAFPMDGGRVLRALLAMRTDYVRATQIAANIGQGMAFLFGFIGLFTNPFLVFVALFVWMGAAQEASMVQMRSALAGIPINRVMITDFPTLSPEDPLKRASDLALAGFQQDFPVVANGRVVGVLTRNDLLRGLADGDPWATIGKAMRTHFETADAAEMLEGLSRRFQSCSCHSLPVLRRGQLTGLLTMDNIGEFLMTQAAGNAAQFFFQPGRQRMR
jgi:Zn-dependent protease/CBS domain-containing protein